MVRRALAVVLIAAIPSLSAATMTRGSASCGTERKYSAGAVFAITGAGVPCKSAKDVAGRWYDAQAEGDSGKKILDAKGRLWRCRITRRATGTDPGFNPYTSVRCARSSAVVRFKLRS